MTPNFEEWSRDWQAMDENADLLLATHDLGSGRGELEDPTLPPVEIFRRLQRKARWQSRREIGLLGLISLSTLVVVGYIVDGSIRFGWLGLPLGLLIGFGVRLAEARRRVRDLDAVIEEWSRST